MDKTLLANAITKALAYTENGGKPNTQNPSSGKTGELKSIFQFTPDTWKNYSKQVLGSSDIPLTADSESYVVHKKVTNWLDKGYTPAQIASMWNAGVGEPDAYTGKFSDGTSSVGVNKKYNVKYNVPEYANKVESYTKQFLSGNNESNTNNPKTVSENQPPELKNVIATIQGAKSTPTQNTTSNTGMLSALVPKTA